MIVIAVNKRTLAESPMTIEHWEKIKDHPHWKGVFYLKNIPEPPEVTKLKEAKERAKNSL